MNFCDDHQYIRFLKQKLEELKEKRGDNADNKFGKWNISYANNEDAQDMVNHPPHYEQGGVEVIDIMKAKMDASAFRGYLLGNVLKYLFRFNHKGKPLEDLKKAQWYLNRLIEELSDD